MATTSSPTSRVMRGELLDSSVVLLAGMVAAPSAQVTSTGTAVPFVS